MHRSELAAYSERILSWKEMGVIRGSYWIVQTLTITVVRGKRFFVFFPSMVSTIRIIQSVIP